MTMVKSSSPNFLQNKLFLQMSYLTWR